MFHQRLPFLVAALSILASAAPIVASNILTPQNFEQTVAHGVWFVEHFSPYCRHCRNFEPTWNDLVDHYESMPDPGVHLAQVNCALNGDLCNDNGVTGYPQMNLYRNGVFVESYNTDREFHLLVEYLNKRAEPRGTVAEDPPKPASSQTDQEATPTPTPTPTPTADRLVVQTPRTNAANPSGTVVSLDVQSFDNFLAQGPAFIKFFAPWCGHCKKLAPTWTQLGRHMQHKLNVAEVDCEQHKALCASQGITGFPMLFYYANSVKTEYSGGRSYDQLVSFAEKASHPNMQVIDAPELDQVVRDHPVFYLLLHDGSDPHIVTDIAKVSSVLLGSPPIYVSTSSALLQKYDALLTTPSALLAFRDHDAREPIAVFHPALPSTDASALTTWLHTHRFPSSLELSKDVFQQVMYAPHKPLVVIVATPEGQHGTVSHKLAEVAQKWRLRPEAGGARDVVFTWMDAGQWGKWLKDMYGVRTGSVPVIVVADHARLVYYDRDAAGHAIAFNSVSIASALDAILTGRANARQSRNMMERSIHSLTGAFVRLEASIAAHPYVTVLVILGLVGAVVLALRTALTDEPVDWETEQRYTKGGRVD